ncbi:MAG TPA: hypothetical protein VIQ30_19290 [Pseudonocardia sp.]|jgi:hypothetical protein
MAEGMVGPRVRRLIVPLIVMAGATLGWSKARRRQPRDLTPRSWSELDPVAPASLYLVPAEPVAPEPVPVLAAAPAEAVTAKEREVAPAAGPPPGNGPTPGPYAGSVLPLDDGSAPSDGFLIKGNAGSMRSHSPDSPYFARTRAEVWFRTQADAIAAGFVPWAPRK